MFYPVESLKRGGRFYLCWVADSWPLRFAAITRRQLWSQDIRELCDELLEVVTMESGRPANRFSLRLSSQLMRGLVRLYERKATVLLSDLCMINAHVFKSMNRRQAVQAERPARRHPQPPGALAEPRPARTDEPDEQKLEEMIQNSGNIVANIQDITLREAAIPEFQLPPNDNFGEENPDQALQLLLADRTPELMLQETSVAQISALSAPDRPLDQSHDQSHDKSRAPHDAHAMESIAELDVTLFRKSNAEDLRPAFEKDVPEIPEVLPAELPAPTEPIPPQAQMEVEQQVLEVPEVPAPPPEFKEPEQPEHTRQEQPEQVEQPVADARRQRRTKETDDDSELEELEAAPARRTGKRRARTSLIVDKRTKLDSDTYRARVDNPRVEMRFEDFTEAIVDIRPTADALMHRMARAGYRLHCNISARLARLYQRNLGLASGVPLADRQEQLRQMEQLRERRARLSEPPLEKIPEVEEPQQVIEPALVPPTADAARATEGQEAMLEVPTEMLNVTAPLLDVSALNVPSEAPNQMQVDISDLPTQKLETLSQAAKRTSEYESPAKKQRSVGYVSFRESQQHKSMQPPEIIVDAPDKENIPPNIQQQSERAVTERLSTRQLQHSARHQPIVLLEKLSIPHERSFVPIEQPTATIEQPLEPIDQPLAPIDQPLAPIDQPLAPIDPPLAPIEQPLPPIEQPLPPISCSQADAARMLVLAGLSDIQPPVATQTGQRESGARKRASTDSSETPLGSLDRTKVSLGDSEKTTDTQRFMRTEWGIEGTMTKLLFLLHARNAGGAGGAGRAVSLGALLRRGPLLAGRRRLVAARCFTSLLKLKQHGFIRVTKDPGTLEILDITLGPRFDNM